MELFIKHCNFFSRNKNNNKVVAIKKMYIEECDEGIPSNNLREISILKKLNHPNIVKLIS